MAKLRDEEGVSILYITHDIASARYVADRLIVMYAGQIAETGPIEDVLTHPRHPYTQLLLSAVPDPRAPLSVAAETGRGEPPRGIDPVPGCRFRWRVPLAIEPVSARIMAADDHPGEVRWTDSVDDGTEGADAILFQLRIGGQAARHRDETWPLDCGCVGQETTGAGGFAKALRTVPVVLDLAERARRRASPSAFIIDFTNPVGIVTRALLTAGHRAVGLCNVAIGFQRDFASLLGVTPGRVSLGHVGLNHLTWERSVLLDGLDVLPELLAKHADEIAPHTGMPADFIRHLGMVPSSYLRYYYDHDAVVESLRGAETRAEAVARLEAELLELYADPELDTKPPQLAQRGGAWYSEAAADPPVSLTGDPRDAQAVNTFNHGTPPFPPGVAVIQGPAAVRAGGAPPGA